MPSALVSYLVVKPGHVEAIATREGSLRSAIAIVQS